RKLIPALYQLFRKKRLPPDTKIMGFSRSRLSHPEWRKKLQETTAEFAGKDFQAPLWEEFAKLIYYQIGDIGQEEDFHRLRRFLDELAPGADEARVYYLATAPQFYAEAI